MEQNRGQRSADNGYDDHSGIRDVKVNPCRYCALHTIYKSRHEPGGGEQCRNCKNLLKHKEYLKSQRKFEAGEFITNLDELLSQTWVMFYGRVKHIKVIKCFQLDTIERLIDGNAFRKAINRMDK